MCPQKKSKKLLEEGKIGINFNDLVLEEINFKLNPDFKPAKKIKVDVSYDINYEIDETKKILKVRVGVFIFEKTENAPFKLSIYLLAVYSLEGSFDEEKLKNFADVQAPALIFPFIREIVANITMRTPFPPLLLPPINIFKLVRPDKNLKNKKS